MAMKPQCATAVRAAAGGRPISEAKLQAIEDAISNKMRGLARADRQRWLGLSRDQRMTEAVSAAMEDIKAEAALKEYRAGLNVIRIAESEQRIADAMGLNGLTRSQALSRDIENTGLYVDGVRNDAISGMVSFLDAAESREGVGAMRSLGMSVFSLDNPAMTADIVREVFRNADGSTGNAAAKKAAEAWLSTVERLRERFNTAGGNVGKLGYGYLSQAHDMWKVLDAGVDRWSSAVLPLLDRERYVNADGSLMNDAQLRDLLGGAWETISTDGANKAEPGAFKATPPRANRGSDHRVLHFRDGDAWMAYMTEYGEGSLYDSMIGHIGKMARDVGLIERYGSNPEHWFRLELDLAQRADGVGTMPSRLAGNQPEAYWAIATGRTGSPENRLIAARFQDLRNVQTAAKISWGPLAALADAGTILQTLHYDRIPYFEYLKAVGRRFSAGHREQMTAHGVISESLLSSLNRWTGDNMTHSATGRVANAVMKLSLMNAWTDNLRSAFADVMMLNFAKKVGKAWGQLDAWDRYLMERKGITEADWSIITQAAPTAIEGRAFLTHRAIASTGIDGAQQVATKWLGFVSDEAQFAVVNPDMATRAIVTGGGMPAGTFNGEAMRSVAQFKSFPLAMLTRHWRRVFETPQGLEGAPLGYGASNTRTATVNRVAVLAALAVTTTLLGAIQTQLRAVVSGKDPISMDPTDEHGRKFWAKAFSAGGGAGFFGDVLLAPGDDPSRQWEGHLGLAGPIAGAFGGLVDIAKDQHHAARAVRWGSDQLPFVDMWQVRALYEHWFLHSAQEMLNPGYLSRMRQRAMKDWGQGYWWTPGEALPDRAPDFERAVGQ
jgi:hypothetical protein